MTPGEVVGEALRTRRTRDGWTAESAAERATISYPTWRRLERGQPVRRGNMDKIDELYGLPAGTTARAVDNVTAARRYAATLNPLDDGDAPAPGPTRLVSAEHDISGRAHDALTTAYDLDRQLRELARTPDVDRELREAAYRISYRLTRELPTLSRAAYADIDEVMRLAGDDD